MNWRTFLFDATYFFYFHSEFIFSSVYVYNFTGFTNSIRLYKYYIGDKLKYVCITEFVVQIVTSRRPFIQNFRRPLFLISIKILILHLFHNRAKTGKLLNCVIQYYCESDFIRMSYQIWFSYQQHENVSLTSVFQMSYQNNLLTQ